MAPALRDWENQEKSAQTAGVLVKIQIKNLFSTSTKSCHYDSLLNYTAS